MAGCRCFLLLSRGVCPCAGAQKTAQAISLIPLVPCYRLVGESIDTRNDCRSWGAPVLQPISVRCAASRNRPNRPNRPLTGWFDAKGALFAVSLAFCLRKCPCFRISACYLGLREEQLSPPLRDLPRLRSFCMFATFTPAVRGTLHLSKNHPLAPCCLSSCVGWTGWLWSFSHINTECYRRLGPNSPLGARQESEEPAINPF